MADAAAATGTASVTEAGREGGRKRETSSENIGITKINMNISGARPRRWLNHRAWNQKIRKDLHWNQKIRKSENQERSSQAKNHDQAEVLSLKTERYQNGKTQ